MIYKNKNPKFFAEVTAGVDNYFKYYNLSKKGNWKSYLDAILTVIIFLGLISSPYVFNLSPFWHYCNYFIAGSVFLPRIGFLAHEAMHGAFSENEKHNILLGRSFDLLAHVSSFLWGNPTSGKHTNHHKFTNIHEMDDDIKTNDLFRFAPRQPWHPKHRFQFIYAQLLYPFLYKQWVFFTDFQKMISRKVGATEIKHIPRKEIVIIIASKLLHVSIYWIIPCFIFGFWEMLFAYACLTFPCGWVLTNIFQPAHVQGKAEFPYPDPKTGNIENDWAIMQVQTTANFAVKSKFMTWFTAGLNFQVPHHLFPGIHHRHYKKINRFVKRKCKKFNVTYNEYLTLVESWLAHEKWLIEMGKEPV
jgi:linoleoyl-CoA desaturase